MSSVDSDGGTPGGRTRSYRPTQPGTRRGQTIRLVLLAARRGGWPLALLVVATALLAGAEAVLPATLGRSLDAIIGNRAAGWWIGATAAVVAVLVTCDVVDDICSSAATARSTRWLRRVGLRRLLHARHDAGSIRTIEALTRRLVINTADVATSGSALLATASSLVLGGVGVAALFLIDPWLLVTFAAAVPVFTVVITSFIRESAQVTQEYLEHQAEITHRLAVAQRGGRTIAAAATRNTEAERILQPLPLLHRAGRAVWHAHATVTARDTLLLTLVEIAVLAVAGVELARGRITPGELYAASQYVILASTLSSSIGSVSGLVRARAAADRLGEVMSLQPTAYGTAPLPPGDGTLELRDVTLRSGATCLVDHLSLVIPGGTFAAVVGSSGSGKSLVAQLVCRLLDPHTGDVLLDGVSLRSIDHDSLRRSVCCAFDEPTFLGETVEDAVAFGVDAIGGADAARALRMARVDDFVARLPLRERTRLSETPMSGGEGQRLAIARAFGHLGRVLVLDDVAANLDSVTEQQIGQVVTFDLRGLTRIVVARRRSTAARADRVLWLERGRLRGWGRHDQLWQDPSYRAVFPADGQSTRDADQPREPELVEGTLG